MTNKRIRTFQENIRRIFILEAIIPVFCISAICLMFFFHITRYEVKKSSEAGNHKICQEITHAVHLYQNAMCTLSKNEEIDWSGIDCDEIVDIKQMIYQMTKETNYHAEIYVLDEKLNPIVWNGDPEDTFLCRNLNPEVGILREIDEHPDEISIRVTSLEAAYLCLGTSIRQNRFQGYIIASFEAKEFETLLTKISPQTIITDSRGWSYLANQYEFMDTLQRFPRKYADCNGFVVYEDHSYYLLTNKILGDNLVVYTITDQAMRKKMNWILDIAMFIIFCMIIFITYMVSGKLSRRSTADIQVMSEAFEQVKQGKLDRYLSIQSSIEFKMIGEAYNMMLDGLKQNIEEKKELAEHAAFAQVKQLEAQFNPHFLFNTLDNIRFMSKIDSDKADQMIVSLSSLLRYSISTSEEEILVSEELTFTQNYLNILKIRFNQRLTYELDVEEEVYQCRIPKLLIQPLIENAVKYGLMNRQNLNVVVKGYQKGDVLVFTCHDDGAGIETEKLFEIQKLLEGTTNRSGHYGLFSIQRRIQLMYGSQYGLTIDSKEGEGTRLTLQLPVNQRKGEEIC